MRKGVHITLAVLLVLCAGVLAWQHLRPQEPVYGGRRLSACLADCNRRYGYGPVPDEWNQDPAVKAIREIGTNGLPVLLRMARVIDSPFKSKLLALFRKQSLIPLPLRTEDDYHHMACFGFYVLKGAGKDAVPALIDLLSSTNTNVRLCAVTCLGNIGPPAKAAVPLLVRSINDPNRYARFGTTVTLMRIHEDAASVVPVLITNLTESNVILPTTILALASFGDQAKPAVPALVRLLGSNRGYVCEAAANALKQIDPEAAAKAGVK